MSHSESSERHTARASKHKQGNLMGNLLLTHLKNECKQQNKRYEKREVYVCCIRNSLVRVNFVDVIGYCLVDIDTAQALNRRFNLENSHSTSGNFEPLVSLR